MRAKRTRRPGRFAEVQTLAGTSIIGHAASNADDPIEHLFGDNGVVARTSPIELSMMRALIKVLGESRLLTFWDLSETDPLPGETFVMAMQAPIGRYTADFLVGRLLRNERECESWGLTVVEADGHEYHERTKKQAAHDRRRDRWMQQAGFHVMRFTGSEIYRDADRCALEVADFLRGPAAARPVDEYKKARALAHCVPEI